MNSIHGHRRSLLHIGGKAEQRRALGRELCEGGVDCLDPINAGRGLQVFQSRSAIARCTTASRSV